MVDVTIGAGHPEGRRKQQRSRSPLPMRSWCNPAPPTLNAPGGGGEPAKATTGSQTWRPQPLLEVRYILQQWMALWRINDFMEIAQLTDLGPPLNERESEAFEKQIGYSLPKGYRAFLLATNGGDPGDAGSVLVRGALRQPSIWMGVSFFTD